MDDSEIVNLYLDRDETAITQTSLVYGSRLRAVADRILCDSGAAEECENDTYFTAWSSIPPAEPRGYLFAFLCRITRHLAIDRCRRRNAGKRSARFCELTAELSDVIASDADVEARIDADQLGRSISGYLCACTKAQREIFVRRYYFFETVQEISSRTGRTPGSVKTMLSRTRAGLREHLAKEGYTI